MNVLLDEDFLKKIESLTLLARRAMRGEHVGRHRTYRRGSSLEFCDYRDYRQGDDYRFLDLSIMMRLNTPVIKLFESLEDLTIHIFIDTSDSMEYGVPSKFAYARRTAAALGFIGVSQLDRVRIVPVTDIPQPYIAAGSQRGSSAYIFEFLEQLEAGGPTDLSRALGTYALHIRQPGLAIILSDLLGDADILDGLRALLYRGFDILVIQILHPDELNPTVTGSTRLIDRESRESVGLYLDSRRITEYQQYLRQHLTSIESFCIEHGIEYIRATTELPVENLLFEYITRGAHLK